MSSLPFLTAIAAAALLLSACGEERVASYRVPKEKEPEPQAAAPADAGAPGDQGGGAQMASTPVPTASGAELVWEAPAPWKSKPASPMRKASFAVPGDGAESELSVTAFPGDVGGELANVNRWRGQVGLPLLRAEDLDSAVSRVESNGLKITIVELFPQGDPAAKSILGAIVPFGGSTWFFKLTGPGTSVKSSRPAFIGFLHTVRAP
jgi:hypothetical protein